MKHTKTLLAMIMSLSLLAGCSSNSNSTSTTEEKTPVVGLAQLVDHSSLNTIRQAFLNELEAKGYTDGENITIDYQNAAGQISNLDTIMSNYSSEGADVIVAIATPTAQAAQNYSKDIPVIFSAVSDPVGAGLVSDPDKPNSNITGTSDEVQVDQIAELITKLTPEAKTVGVLYNAGEANSVSNIERFKEEADKLGLEVVEKTGTDLTTLQQAASVLAEQVDVVFSPNDNTVASGMSALGKIFEDAGVPYYVGADSMVQDGGFATVGINYEDLGTQTADMVIEVLNGTEVASLPVRVFKENLNTYINENVLAVLEKDSETVIDADASLDNVQYLK